MTNGAFCSVKMTVLSTFWVGTESICAVFQTNVPGHV